jgi:hypothetical protein
MSTTFSPGSEAEATGAASRLWPLSGLAAAVCFVGSVVASSPPKDSASNAKWIAAYTGSHDAAHMLTGTLLVLSGLMFLVFIVTTWRRLTGPGLSPLPICAAAVTAACMGVGGVLMAAASIVVKGSHQVPSPDVLRLGNDVGFTMVALPGMLSAGLAVAVLSTQARRAGLFGPRLALTGYLCAALLIAALAFVPILVFMLWVVVAAVTLLGKAEAQ